MGIKRLSPQEQLRIVLEGLRGDASLSELCRRENIYPVVLNNGIYPNEYYRMKDKVISGAIESLKNNRKKKDDEKNSYYSKNPVEKRMRSYRKLFSIRQKRLHC